MILSTSATSLVTLNRETITLQFRTTAYNIYEKSIKFRIVARTVYRHNIKGTDSNIPRSPACGL